MKDRLSKDDANNTDERLREAVRLYRTGLTLREVGSRLTPPISQQRVSKMFVEAFERGALRELPQARRRRGADLTDDQVRDAARRTSNVAKIARSLRVDEEILRIRFDDVLRDVTIERAFAKAELGRRDVLQRYLELVDEAGRLLNATELSPAFVRRISRAYGSFDLFWAAVGSRPARRKFGEKF